MRLSLVHTTKWRPIMSTVSTAQDPTGVLQRHPSAVPGGSLSDKDEERSIHKAKSEHDVTDLEANPKPDLDAEQHSRYRSYILVGFATLILGWWISSTVLKATRHRWYAIAFGRCDLKLKPLWRIPQTVFAWVCSNYLSWPGELSDCWCQVLPRSHIFPVCTEQIVLPTYWGCLGSYRRTTFPWSPILCPPHYWMALSTRDNIWLGIWVPCRPGLFYLHLHFPDYLS